APVLFVFAFAPVTALSMMSADSPLLLLGPLPMNTRQSLSPTLAMIGRPRALPSSDPIAGSDAVFSQSRLRQAGCVPCSGEMLLPPRPVVPTWIVRQVPLCLTSATVSSPSTEYA